MLARGLTNWGGLCALVTWLVLAAAAAAAPPNIVILLTDDQRWDAVGFVQAELGAAGRFPWLVGATPNIDRLAAEGFRFRNAYRRQLLVLAQPGGAADRPLQPSQRRRQQPHAVSHGQSPPSPTVLKAAGYHTGYFGKWHMGNQAERPGFTEYASFVGQGPYDNARFLVNGASVPTVGWTDDVSTDFAIDFIRQRAGTPFALVLGFKSPHAPWDAPAAPRRPVRRRRARARRQRHQLCALRSHAGAAGLAGRATSATTPGPSSASTRMSAGSWRRCSRPGSTGTRWSCS